MLQVIQFQKTGDMYVEEVPAPTLRPGGVLVQNHFSLVSAGTERSSVETAQASMLGKAQKRPDLVKQVKDSVKKEGLRATWEKVKTRLENFKELGYSTAGVVIESATDEFKPGDRVACAGGGYASHAEMVYVPKNLLAKIPAQVSFEEASFTTLGAIAMQGVRQANPRIGESVAVVGLGLLGLITVQLLKANGCRVIGLDISDANFEMAKRLGCDECVISGFDALPAVNSFTRGYGTDAVIITAATKANEPVELALHMARKKSSVVVVGAVSMNIPRSPFYEKEIDFRISCSYGPGRYDADYEEGGKDYPLGYVRWTENRNMEAILDLMASGALDVKALISHKIPIKNALKAYDIITGKVKELYLGILIQYPSEAGREVVTRVQVNPAKSVSGQPVIGFIGAGNFAQSYLIPPLRKSDARLKGVMTADPVNAKSVAKKFEFEYCASDADEIFKDKDINTVFVATRHDSHAALVLQGLQNGKHVYVEKPLAVTAEQLADIVELYEKEASPAGQRVMVGFNRRYSAPFRDMKTFFTNTSEPLVVNYRVNAGFIPKDHWTQAQDQGGRMIGEGCHFIDCMAFLTDSRPVSVYAACVSSDNTQVTNSDNVSVVITFDDGSVGNLLYLANGDRALGKEFCQVFGGGKIASMDNFSRVSFYENGKKTIKKYDGSKGHSEEVDMFLKAVQAQADPSISFESLVDTTLVTFKVLESLQSGQPVSVRD